jgi:hypothetical protein
MRQLYADDPNGGPDNLNIVGVYSDAYASASYGVGLIGRIAPLVGLLMPLIQNLSGLLIEIAMTISLDSKSQHRNSRCLGR